MRRGTRLAAMVLLALGMAIGCDRRAAAGWLCDRLGLACPAAADCGPLKAVADFGPNPGGLEMCAYVPHGLPPGRPLVVALHGCFQQAADFALSSGWMQVAETHDFALLLPQQRRANNPLRCFNWFRPDDVRRDDAGGTVGEAASIRAMIAAMQATTRAGAVYVTGLSAGGAMAAALLAAYPEVFQGGAVIAGIPFGCADGVDAAVRCLNPGKDLPAEDWARRVRAAVPGRQPHDHLAMAIWQGDADTTVVPRNADELLEQWQAVLGIDATAEQTDRLPGASVRRFAGEDGRVRIEQVLVHGMAHGLAIDPMRGCGAAASFMLDVGLCSSRLIAQFWGITDGGERPAAPPVR